MERALSCVFWINGNFIQQLSAMLNTCRDEKGGKLSNQAQKCYIHCLAWAKLFNLSENPILKFTTGNCTRTYIKPGGHHSEIATTPYSCHGIFTDWSIFFSLNLSQIQIPTGISVISCNHEHGLMLTCWHDVSRHVDMRLHCFILTKACSCQLELNYFAGKISKNRLVGKNAVALTYYGSRKLLVMGSWLN